MARNGKLRVTIVQELVPHYRVPLFERLAREVNLTVVADTRPGKGSLAPAPVVGAHFEQAELGRIGPFLWQPAAARRREVDVLVLGWNIRRLELIPTLLAARSRRIGTVVWGHGYSKRERAVLRAVRDASGRLADATLFYAEPAARGYAERGNDRTRIFVATNALDQEPIERARTDWLARPRELEEFARQRGIRPDRTVLFIARLEPVKQVGLLLEALARVRRRLPDAKLVLIGSGTDEPLLRSAAARLGIADAVVFAGSLHDQQDIAPWALNTAVAAYPADIGLSVLHVFGFGLPVITHGSMDRHGPEVAALRDGENGLLFREGDVADLAEKLLQVLEEPALARRLGANALATVRGPSGHTLERMVEGFLQAIEFAAHRAGRSTERA